MSHSIQVGPNWPGFSGIRRLIIFGDSYSTVGFDLLTAGFSPTAANPLGVRFPGLTFNEADQPNWVGYLISKYVPAPRFSPGTRDQEKAYTESPLLVYDFAKGGDTVQGVQRQVHYMFLRHYVGSTGQNWTSENALFITWIGINDCAYNEEHLNNIKALMSQQEELYNAGARNFLFIDVPPIEKSPAARYNPDPTSYDNFNTRLRAGARTFATSHPDATVMIFSSSATFNKLLDNPVTYGFDAADPRRPGGLWRDHLHPTSKVHDHVAEDLADFLGSVEKYRVVDS